MGRELSKAHREMKNYRQLMTAERESVSLGAVLPPPPPRRYPNPGCHVCTAPLNGLSRVCVIIVEVVNFRSEERVG